MNRGVVKVCGLTTASDAAFAAEQGADLLGFVVHEPSPRHCLDLVAASRAVKEKAVLVTVGCGAEAMIRLAEDAGIRWIQPHCPPSAPMERRIELIRRLRDAGYWTLQPWLDEPDQAEGPSTLFLWESSPAKTGVAGGSGQNHPMAHPPKGCFLLAGGLEADNLADRLSLMPADARPRLSGFDAASRLESSPGRKDPAKVRAFIRTARHLLEATS